MAFKQTTDRFIQRALVVHGTTYGYDKVAYVGAHKKVTITCSLHGEFQQTPVQHILQRQGCPKCYGNARSDTSTFVSKAVAVHGDTYDYKNVTYRSNDRKVHITCKVHGDFQQTPRNHITRKAGCPHCSGRARLTTAEFIKRARLIHADTYDYSGVDYKNATTPVMITCSIHGTFTQKPTIHLAGCGCPRCNYSKGERIIEQFLKDRGETFVAQYVPADLTNRSKKAHYRFDFFLPEHNMLIEFDGVQHDKPVSRWNSKYSSFDKIRERDEIKTNYARDRDIRLIRIKYKDVNNIPHILHQALNNVELS